MAGILRMNSERARNFFPRLTRVGKLSRSFRDGSVGLVMNGWMVRLEFARGQVGECGRSV